MTYRNSIKILSFTVCISLLFASCGGSKKITGDKTTDTKIEIPAIKIEDYYKQGVNYNTFTGKAAMQYQNAKQSQKLGANIKMNKAKNIWTNINAMGGIVEVARAFITPDSLMAMLPLNRDAYALSYKDGLALIQAELDFATLQNLFIGNPLIEGAKDVKVEEQDGNIIVSLKQNGYNLFITYDKVTQLIKQQHITNTEKKFSCLILQQNYKPLADKQPFSFTRKIEINNNGEQMTMDMDFSKAEINIPADINFRIPESYTIKQIK